jgi:L-cysteate sulfo-lyase
VIADLGMDEELDVSLAEALARIPRSILIEGPTPLQRLTRIEASIGPSLGGVRLYAKRDDVMSLGGGGSKTRKLEYLLGEADIQSADVIVATGGVQSNFTRLLAAACARQALDCELILAHLGPDGDEDYEASGNVLLNGLFGAATYRVGADERASDVAHARLKALIGQHRRPYLTPPGGSSALSALGYARCALELVGQFAEQDIGDAIVVTANGSCGTQAGLLAGFRMLGDRGRTVEGFTVLAPADDCRGGTLAMANGALDLLGSRDRIDLEGLQVSGDQRGGGYGQVTDQMVAAVRLMSDHEGLLLDPVYSGKAFAGLLEAVRGGRYPPGAAVVFLMTGGSPALYAYRTTFAA